MTSKSKEIKKILISRTDNIGDVVLTLLMAGILKKHFPRTTIAFLGKGYTRSILERCTFIDEVYDWNNLSKEKPGKKLMGINADVIIHVFPQKEIAKEAKSAGIRIRIGTSHRIFHWWTCNTLVNLGRKKSPLHESILNLQLTKPLGITQTYKKEDLPDFYGLKCKPNAGLLKNPNKINLIFHPKSKGSGREWPMAYYKELALILKNEKYDIHITGTKEEGSIMKRECAEIFDLENVYDRTGEFSLDQFIDFMGSCNGLLACSTGPLHIASALGKFTLGLYPPLRPMHPGRWAPIGQNAAYLVEDNACNDCKISQNCACIRQIKPMQVMKSIETWE